MQIDRANFRRGFTLIEMILVLLLIAVVAGIVTPNLRNFSAGAKLRDSADQFLALTRLARVQAISTGQVHRVTLDTAGNRCVVAAEATTPQGQELKEISAGMDGSFIIPDGVQIQMNDPQRTPKNYVQFFPNGRTQAAKVRFSMTDSNAYIEVECVAPAEGFAKINGTGVSR